VTIRCKDRPKLLVDTIFTLADIQYLVFHGNADAEGPVVHQVPQFSISFEIFFTWFIFLKMWELILQNLFSLKESCIRCIDGSPVKSHAE